MSFPAHGDDVLNDMNPNSVCLQSSGLQYRSSTMPPTSFEPVPVTDDLCEAILSALGRDTCAGAGRDEQARSLGKPAEYVVLLS